MKYCDGVGARDDVGRRTERCSIGVDVVCARRQCDKDGRLCVYRVARGGGAVECEVRPTRVVRQAGARRAGLNLRCRRYGRMVRWCRQATAATKVSTGGMHTLYRAWVRLYTGGCWAVIDDMDGLGGSEQARCGRTVIQNKAHGQGRSRAACHHRPHEI